MRRFLSLILFLSLVPTFSACTRKKQVWVYTSIYKEVIAEMDPLLKRQFPDLDVQWFQSGSENVAAKVNAELAGGKSRADLLMTSDPFWYRELKESGKFLNYASPAASAVPVALKDSDGAFVTVRMPVMVIGYNSDVITAADAPKSWKELGLPKWKNKVSMGSPLESGTTFTAIAMLTKTFGWDILSELRKQEIVSAGGNNSVITRIETRERPVGIVLLENILKAQSKGSPVRVIYPNDGVIPVPSPIALLKESSNPEGAKKVYDWFFSKEAQDAMLKSGMYSPVLPKSAPPRAKPWSELEAHSMPWSPQVLDDLYSRREQIKAKFSEIVLH